MNNCIAIPKNLRGAARLLRAGFAVPVELMPKRDLVRTWCAVAYLYPGLHPDGFDDDDSGWPRVLRRFAAEVWRRADDGELADEEIYPCKAQWAGIYDRLDTHDADEIARRLQLAADYADSADA